VYVRTFEGLGQVPDYHLPPSGSRTELGYASPPGLVLLNHFHYTVDFDGNISPLPTKLKPEKMAPRYHPTDDRLQQGLRAILKQDPFRNFLVDKTAIKAHADDKIRVALVDLSGGKWFLNAVFAGYGAKFPMRAASLAKVLTLYGARQLKFDLWYLAHFSKPQLSTKDDLIRAAVKAGYPGKKGELPALFDLTEVPGQPVAVKFTPVAADHLTQILGSSGVCASNGSATWPIHHLGYPYMASLAWQSGLRHPKSKGLWLSGDYSTLDECRSGVRRWTPLPNGKRRPEANWPLVWASNPLKDTLLHECNALSMATYFTLLAQGRLATPWSSKQLREEILTRGFPGAFVPAFAQQRIMLTEISSKVGRLKPPDGFVDHQGAIIRRSKSGKNEILYVAVVLSQRVEREFVGALVLKLDELVSSLN
jgi:hypothetical protein